MGDQLTLKVHKKELETTDAVSLYFKQPFFSKVKYKSGQFMTIVVDINGKEHQRAYSLNSTYGVDKMLSITVKRVEDGVVSNYILDHINEGDKVRVLKPRGNFTFTPDPKNKRHIVLIGGGSGITPLISIAKGALTYEPDSMVSLLYCNRNEGSIIFNQKLKQMTLQYGDRFTLKHYLEAPPKEWRGESGLLAADRLSDAVELLPIGLEKEYYICGPKGLMDNAVEGLKLMNVPNSKVFLESFTGKTPLDPANVENLEVLPAQNIKVSFRKKEYDLHVDTQKTVLDAALDAGINIPHSCKSGICSTCLGKVKTGEVKMLDGNCLTDADKKRGYVLACVCYPLSDDVSIEFR